MALENNIELLDNYVANRMSAADKAAFEQQLQQDPQLQRELRIQQHVAEALRQARRAELKTMLGNVPVTGIPGQMSGLAKLAIGTLTAAVIGTVAYIAFKQDKAEVQKPVATEAEVKPEESKGTATAEVKIEESDPTVSAEESATPSRKTKEPAKPNKTKKTEPKKDETVAARPTIEAFNPSEGETSGTEKSAAESIINNDNNTAVASMNKIVAEVDKSNTKYKFHYFLKDNKVTLYGDFESSLYEIIEVFSNEKRTAFLFFNNNYYLMNEDNDKVKPLTPINDPVLLKKLREYRTQKN